MLRFVVCIGLGFQLAASFVVRRVYTDDADVTDSSQEDQSESGGNHCVVWGDWSFEGKKFRSKEDAEAYFKTVSDARNHTKINLAKQGHSQNFSTARLRKTRT